MEDLTCPSIRFNNYSDSWKQYKIGEIVSVIERPIVIQDETTYQLVVVRNKNKGVISRGFYKGKDILVKKYFKLEKGDFIISKRQIVNGASGYVPEDLDGAVVSNEYLVIVSSKQITSEYLNLISQREDMHKMYFLSSYGVDIEKMVFDIPDWKKRYIAIPSVSEQKSITALFTTIDELIKLYHHRHYKLVNLKKALMERMFPKDHAVEPSVRYNGYGDPWNEQLLSELFIKSGSGGTPTSTNPEYYGGDIPFLSIADITNSGTFINKTEKHLSAEGLENCAAWVVPKGSISLAMYASVGKSAILNIDAATSQAFFNMVFDNDDLRDYVFQYLSKTELTGGWRRLISTGTQDNLNALKVKTFGIKKPLFNEEAKAISDLFMALDKLIINNKYKCEKITMVRAALLKKMFV